MDKKYLKKEEPVKYKDLKIKLRQANREHFLYPTKTGTKELCVYMPFWRMRKDGQLIHDRLRPVYEGVNDDWWAEFKRQLGKGEIFVPTVDFERIMENQKLNNDGKIKE
jgi:hypothetical protein